MTFKHYVLAAVIPVPCAWRHWVANDLTGTVRIDGSSTVYPLTEAVAEEFGISNPGVRITVGISGTGGGFKKFCNGEIDINTASRPIKQGEAELCAQTGIDYIEIPVAYDALTVVVHPTNSWARKMTVAELRKVWEPAAQGKITHWDQVRDGWPHTPINLFGPGPDSGTYDYFTEAIVGSEDASRGDFTSSEDDNLLVRGVANDLSALGYFGLGYYLANRSQLEAVAIEDEQSGSGAVLPSRESVMNGTYRPLSRPVFVYFRRGSLNQREVQQFADYYLRNASTYAEEVGFVPLSIEESALVRVRFEKRIVGSMYLAERHKQSPSLLQALLTTSN